VSGKGTPGYKAVGFRSTKKRERDVYWRREKRAWEHDSQGGVKHGKQEGNTQRKATQKWRAAESFIFLITPPPFPRTK